MSTKALGKTQAKTPAAPAAAHVGQAPVDVPEREADRPDIATQLEGAARLGHSLGAISVGSSAPPIVQRQEILEEDEEKLQMKREPAAIQRQVPEEEEEELQMKPESAANQPQELPEEEDEELQMKREPAAIQRQELPEEEEELQMMPEPSPLQRQELPDEEEELQTKPANGVQRQGSGEGFRLDDDTAGRINRARGGGQPLDGPIQEQMGERLGHDFSTVRVHTDAEANDLNQQLQAKAFTTGQDVFFRRGAYSLGSAHGRELIAHELTHVVQQSTGLVSGGGSGLTVRPAGDAFEQESDAIARALRGGDPVAAKAAEGVGVQIPLQAEREKVPGSGPNGTAAVVEKHNPHKQEAKPTDEGARPSQEGKESKRARVGDYQIQRAVVTTMDKDDWLAEMNMPLALKIAGDPEVQWGAGGQPYHHLANKSNKVVVMGHGEPGVLKDQRATPAVDITGKKIAEELDTGGVPRGAEVILWSCSAGEKAGGSNKSLVDDTWRELQAIGKDAKRVSGAVGVHIPNVDTGVRHVGPKNPSADLRLYEKLERHYRHKHCLAKDKGAKKVVIPWWQRKNWLKLRGNKPIMIGASLHKWPQVYQEVLDRGILSATSMPALKVKVSEFYKDLFKDPDVKMLLKPITKRGKQQVREK